MKTKQIQILYPLKLENGMAHLNLPPLITKKDADRLCKMIQLEENK